CRSSAALEPTGLAPAADATAAPVPAAIAAVAAAAAAIILVRLRMWVLLGLGGVVGSEPASRGGGVRASRAVCTQREPGGTQADQRSSLPRPKKACLLENLHARSEAAAPVLPGNMRQLMIHGNTVPSGGSPDEITCSSDVVW